MFMLALFTAPTDAPISYYHKIISTAWANNTFFDPWGGDGTYQAVKMEHFDETSILALVALVQFRWGERQPGDLLVRETNDAAF